MKQQFDKYHSIKRATTLNTSKWKGYSNTENSWEPQGNVQHAEEVETFHKKYPTKLKPTSSHNIL